MSFLAKQIFVTALFLGLGTASAATTYESGNFVVGAGAGHQANQTQYSGWMFTLPVDTQVTAVGGTLYMCQVCGANTAGTMFAAIVGLPAANTPPTDSPLNFTPLGTALFDPPQGYAAGSLTSIDFSLFLPAGNYALIFGSGRFGATSVAGAMMNVGSSPSQLNTSLLGTISTDSWGTWSNGHYFFVTGDEVPEPSSMLLSLAGLATLGALRRLRKA